MIQLLGGLLGRFGMAMHIAASWIVENLIEYPEELVFEVKVFFDAIIDWLIANLGGFFDVIAYVIRNIFLISKDVLLFVPWWLYVIGLFFLGWKLYHWKMGILLAAMLAAIGMFGLWTEMIYTLTIVVISVIVSILIAIPMGIWMAKSKSLEVTLKPILDMMQTLPSFVYLLPAIMLFEPGSVPAVFATTIYAVPPLIRLTYLGISNVDTEVIEAGKAFGSTPWQMLRKVELPQALSTIMTGVNQTTMMAMAMVVIASMIGAQGIGYKVLFAIQNLEVGAGFQAGFAIVFLAIILDRILQGLTATSEEEETANA